MTYRDDNVGVRPIYETTGDRAGECGWCSNGPLKVYHYGPCPRVESIEYHPDGTVKRVEFRDS